MYEIRFRPWLRKKGPRKVLVMRFQALGDTIITLPYLQSLKRQNPAIKLHLLTRNEVCAIPQRIDLFDRVITFAGGRNAKLQFILVLLKLPDLWRQGYDLVLDLQNNRISIILRKLLAVSAWAEFDKYSPISAGSRTKNTIDALGLWSIKLDTQFKINVNVENLLVDNGWKKDHELVALNPAGFCPSRNWPLNYYVAFAKLWLEKIGLKSQFVLILLPALKDKADYIAGELKEYCINLIGKTSQPEAFAILQKCKFILTEDSGLMHMAWVQGVPTLALFSSTRKDWSAPQGEWSECLDSSDMECGPCLLEVCKFGDNRCITRYSPNFVIEKSRDLIKNSKNHPQAARP